MPLCRIAAAGAPYAIKSPALYESPQDGAWTTNEPIMNAVLGAYVKTPSLAPSNASIAQLAPARSRATSRSADGSSESSGGNHLSV